MKKLKGLLLALLFLTLLASSVHAAESWTWKKFVAGVIPENSMYFGGPNKRAYVCANLYENYPANGRILNNQCVFAYRGREVKIDDFYTLVISGYRWIEFSKFDQLPANAIYNTPGNNESIKVYLCAVELNDQNVTGQIYENRCYIGFNGREQYFGYYWIPLSLP